MARYEHLKIYQVNYQWTCEVFNLTKKFPREHRFSFGERLRNAVLDIATDIYRINNSQDKLSFLNQYLENLVAFDMLMRLAKDLSLVSVNELAGVMEKIIGSVKMTESWKQYCVKQMTKIGPECAAITAQSS